MLVSINGEEFDLKKDCTIQEAIDISNAPYTPGSIICLIKGKTEFEKNINKFKIKTNQGSIIIEMSDDPDAIPLINVWKEKYKDLINLNIRWSTSNELAIGPFKTDLKPTKERLSYLDGDVLLSLSSFSNESTHIIFIKDKITNIYATPEFNSGIFAKVIGGKKVLNLLTEDDFIIDIEPIIERNTVVDSSSISDLNIKLNEGNQLFTYVSIEIDEESPSCVEHLFSLIEDGRLKVDFEANTFLSFNNLQGIDKPQEDTTLRSRGTITVRNTGKGVGKVYIYRENRILAPSHTTVGMISKGMEIIDIAKENDFITIKSDQERLMALGTTQKETFQLLSSMGIEHIREGLVDDDAIVVEQDPLFTVDIIKNKKLKTKGIQKQDLGLIELTDNAPRTKWYFKKITGLVENPVGRLKVHFAFPGMKLVMFEGNSKESKGLIPENSPSSCIESGIIGVTNMSRKNTGLIGVRFEENDEFGPTGEPFTGTNIVGKIKGNLEYIEKLKDGDILYVRES
ncbi:methanogenesis marker 3 protein [Methanobrevibacter sp. OttesenSCG-928-K11]|nr:methanogenesis marker 3 protein [Methanobrevibacter sp. OttesenSCG-928-K11]MDL2270830.1 methanogenesis marker 3 protein [Methanobrevibacter sp. OttesenSCG-928-I08]